MYKKQFLNTYKELAECMMNMLEKEIIELENKILKAEADGVKEESPTVVVMINEYNYKKFTINVMKNLLTNNPFYSRDMDARDKWLEVTGLDKKVYK